VNEIAVTRRLLVRTKANIMMAFLLTRPISRTTPINPIMLNSVSQSIGASTAPTPADGGVERMVSDECSS
jgi:hypothetical protein